MPFSIENIAGQIATIDVNELTVRNLKNIPLHLNQSAATTAGLVKGDIFKTTTTGVLAIVL